MIISNDNDKSEPGKEVKTIKTLNPKIGGWDVVLSESSDSENEDGKGEKPKKVCLQTRSNFGYTARVQVYRNEFPILRKQVPFTGEDCSAI